MQANKLTLDNIFSPKLRLLAPLFQRPYVWERDNNWMPLWESIRDLAERRLQGGNIRPHFLGAVVLNAISSATGDVSAREIIDGQQRLTTLQVLIAAIRDLCGQLEADNYQRSFVQWLENNTPDRTNPDKVFKVWPTNVDREHFRRVLQARSPFTVYHAYRSATPALTPPQGFGSNDNPKVRSYLLRRAGLTDEDRNAAYNDLGPTLQKEADLYIATLKQIGPLIPNAYFYFYAVLLEWLNNTTDQDLQARLDALYQTMEQDLVLVVIDLDEKDDAQQIFETMNALGAPLLPADLVKNFLFRSAVQQDLNVDHLYTTHWQVFDSESGWREEVRQGRLKRPRLDLFLQHYLALVTGEETLVTDLFHAYRQWALRQNRPADVQLAHFRHYADIYWKFERFPSGSREALFFKRLGQLDTTTILPLMLEVFAQHMAPGEDQAIRAIMVDLESYLVRRAICGLSPKNYNQFFRGLLKQLSEDNDFSPAAIRQALVRQTADTTRWPGDSEFRTAWMERPLYIQQVQQRTRMVLEALEGQLHTAFTNAVAITGTITIEHLMPQKWESHWPLPADADEEQSRRQRNTLIHTLGNLTIVSKALNPSLSNGPWSQKLPAILQNSGLSLSLGLPATWDEAAIQARGLKLFNAATAIWPYPVQS